MLYEVSNQSVISKTKVSAGAGESLFWTIQSVNDYFYKTFCDWEYPMLSFICIAIL